MPRKAGYRPGKPTDPIRTTMGAGESTFPVKPNIKNTIKGTSSVEAKYPYRQSRYGEYTRQTDKFENPFKGTKRTPNPLNWRKA